LSLITNLDSDQIDVVAWLDGYGANIRIDFPTITVDPPACILNAQFTCTVIQSFYTGTEDMCGSWDEQNGQYNTIVEFDPVDGEYQLFTNDFLTIQPGNYINLITV
jgi:hypothetical protein